MPEAQQTNSDGDGSILVVEDDPEINSLVGAYARIAGFRYRSALTGGDALAEVHAHRPSLIMLDLMLPDLSGLEVCRRVRAAEDGRHVPVVILTAMDNDESRQESSRCGAEEYMTKPFDPDDLMRVMKRYAGVEGR